MAAKAIDIQTKKRKSRRIRAANKFLSNISLDGKLPSERNKKDAEKNRRKQPLSLDKEEVQLISNQSFVQEPSSQTKPKLLTSFSTTDAIEETKNSLDLAGSVSSTFQFNNSQEHARFYNRANSVREPKHSQSNYIVSGRHLTKYEGHLCGKRWVVRTWPPPGCMGKWFAFWNVLV